MNRKELSELIEAKLSKTQLRLKNQYIESKTGIGYFVVDDLLPQEIAEHLYESFPQTKDAVLKKSLREYKYVAYQMNEYDPILEEAIYAFQQPKVVKLIAEICDLQDVFPDNNLYAGGLSLMKHNNFLNPHLDNSHDMQRDKYRVLNILYYVTPDWKLEYGGNLELWPNGVKDKNITVESKFNRLVVMVTHNNSWHSVSKVKENKTRCCISNYYFSNEPVLNEGFHVTSFRARPNQKVKDFILVVDNKLRMSLRKLFRKGIRKNPHHYKK